MRKIFILSLFLACLATILSGCFRHCYRATTYNLDQTDLTSNVQKAFEKSDLITSGNIVYEAWWQFFQDPQLNKFIELSLACHPDIKIAEARIVQACQEAGIARSALLPHIFAMGSIERRKISEFGPGFVPGFPDLFTQTTLELTTAFYELDIWQKNRSLYYSALDEMQAAVADFEEAKLLLATTIARVYFDLQMQIARQELTRKRLKAREDLYELHLQQFRLGIISEFRLYQVATQVQLLKDLIFQLDRKIEIDKHAIAALVSNVACVCGEDGELKVMPAAQFDNPFPLPTSLPIDLLMRRPDITARKWLVEAACYDIKAARANFFPRIDLLGFIGFQSIRLDRLFRGETLIADAAATATLPLFLAGKLRAELGVARESLEIAIEEYNRTVLKAVQQVSDALTDLITANERKKSLDLATDAAAHLLGLTEQRYQNAIYNRIAVLNAMENLYEQQDLDIQAQLDRYEGAVAVIQAIGGGYYECIGP